VVFVRESTVTVIWALRDMHTDLSVAIATPLQFVVLVILSVVVGGGSKLPESAVNVTTLLHTGLLQGSFTVAVIVAVSSPSAKMESGARVTLNVAGEPVVTVMFRVSWAKENPWT
jgi:hypothetical protein